MRPRFKSYGDSSTKTRSPGRILMKCLRILPEIWASTWCWLSSSSTRNIAFGSVSRTLAITSIASSFAIPYVRHKSPFAGKLQILTCAFGNSKPGDHPRLGVESVSGHVRNSSVPGVRPHKRQHFRAFVGDRDGMFRVRAGLSVHGHHRPAILKGFGVQRTQIDHRFNRKHVPLLDLDSLSRLPVVGNLRILVHAPADAVPHIVPDH